MQENDQEEILLGQVGTYANNSLHHEFKLLRDTFVDPFYLYIVKLGKFPTNFYAFPCKGHVKNNEA